MKSRIKLSFDTALEQVLKNEGGYVDHPEDRGGKTNYGITQKTLSDFLGRDASDEEIQNISMDTVRQIYRQNYWDRLKLSHIIDMRLAHILFDQAVNRGTRKVAEQIQKLVGVTVDGVIGPVTLKAINDRVSDSLIFDFIKQSQLSYISIVEQTPSQIVFLKGWIKRTHEYI